MQDSELFMLQPFFEKSTGYYLQTRWLKTIRVVASVVVTLFFSRFHIILNDTIAAEMQCYVSSLAD